MRSVLFAAMLALVLVGSGRAQLALSEQNYQVFDGKGNAANLEQILKALDAADVVFLGEQHDDAVAHALENEIFRRAVADYGSRRTVGLSMEMFERDVQVVLDEYLTGLITESQFLASSRPWANYKTDYRPLVEFAKEKKIAVIAANAPRRYVNMVSRNGREALNSLSPQAKEWLPPLPYGEPSPAYAAKFRATMGGTQEAQMGLDKILASQSLWDAAMSNAVASFLNSRKRALVVHLNGGFHTESRLGTVEHLLRYRPKTRALVVTIRYEEDFRKFDPVKHMDLGDFVILTDAKQPRSQR